MALSDIDQRNCAITTIVMESVGWVHKTIEVSHAAGWLPGQLLYGLIGGAGIDNKRIPNALLIEKDLVGETVHDSYDANETLLVWYPQPADRAAMRLQDSTSIEEGDYVVPAASGDVRKYVDGVDEPAAIMGIAQADLDLTGANVGGINLLEVLLF